MTDQNSIRLVVVADLSDLSNEFKTIYEEAFPPDERREWQQIADLLSNPVFNFFGIYDQEKIIGLLSVWNLNEFHFIEHFAIQRIDRGKGFGSQVIRQLLDRISTSIILEVDLPTTELAQRRIAFYTRLNFHICEINYFQPPYSTGNNKVKMLLMSFPNKINGNEFIQARRKIYSSVYNLSE